MKLCRFELKTDPLPPRSGMVFGGKVYETDGATAIGVYESSEIRPLSPVPLPPSLRIFRSDLQPLPQPEADDPHFYYGNPGSLVGTNQVIQFPDFASRVIARAYVAAVMVTSGYRIDIDQADDAILGMTLVIALSAPDVEAREARLGGFGRSGDIGGVIGPVLTTPDELDDFLVDQEYGKRYGLTAVTRVNGVDRSRGNLELLPFTFAEAIVAASRSCTLREGDVLAMGPLVDEEEPVMLEPGDEFQLSVENLGGVALKLSEEQ